MSFKLKSSTNQGFTLVELLIVIVVIAILAAITIVAYGNVTAKAHDSGYQSDAASIASMFESFNADTGAYPVASNISTGVLSAPTGFTGTLTARQASDIKISVLATGATAVAPTGTGSTLVGTASCTAASLVWAQCSSDGGNTNYYNVYFCGTTTATTGAVIYYVKTAGGNTIQHATAGSGC